MITFIKNISTVAACYYATYLCIIKQLPIQIITNENALTAIICIAIGVLGIIIPFLTSRNS